MTEPRRRRRVLFLCTGNACRSQMAEGWARHLHGDALEARSAGVAPHGVDPVAVAVMAEAGVDLSEHRSKHVDELADERFDAVVTVCDRAREACPALPDAPLIIHRDFDDPPRLASDSGPGEALDHYRRVRDEIRDFVRDLPRRLAEAGA